MDDLRQSLEQDPFDAFVQFGNPMIEVGVTFQVELVDGCLDLAQEVGEGFGRVGACGEVFNVAEDVFVQVDYIVGFVLQKCGQ